MAHTDATVAKARPAADFTVAAQPSDNDTTRPAVASCNKTAFAHADEFELSQRPVIMDLYRVEAPPIEEGGMGIVLKVHHKSWNVDLMLKQPRAEFFSDEVQKENFIRECDAWINLGLHPHIVACYYVRLVDDIPAIFGEWMDGGSLKHFIANRRLYAGGETETRARILDIAIQTARGLHFAHEQKLVHQDVKPDNILLAADGTAKVADFGIARARAALAVANALTLSDGTIMSEYGGYSPAYCSPEQAARQPLTRRSDIWSWAVAVLEMYTGERLWPSGVVAGTAFDNYLGQERVAIGAGMAALLRQCFQLDEAARPHDFMAVEQRLLAIFRDETGTAYARTSPDVSGQTPDFLNNKALSYLDLGDAEKALANWNKALEIDHNHPDVCYNRALFLWRRGQIDDLQCFDQLAMLTTQGSWKASYYQGLIQLERKRHQEAVALLEEALALGADAENVRKALTCAAKMQANAEPGKSFSAMQNYPVKPCRLSPNGEYALFGAKHKDQPQAVAARGLLLFSLAQAGKSNISPTKIMLEFAGTLLDALFFHDSRRVAACGGNKKRTVQVSDVIKNKTLRLMKLPEAPNNPYGRVKLTLSGDDKRLAAVCQNGDVFVWDADKGKLLKEFKLGGDTPFEFVQLNHDGSELAVFNVKNGCATLQTWHLAPKAVQLLNSFALGADITATAMSPDFAAFFYARAHADNVESNDNLTVRGSAIYMCDLQTGAVLHTLRSHAPVKLIVPARDREHLYTISGDRYIRFWDLSAERCLYTGFGPQYAGDYARDLDAGADGYSILYDRTDLHAEFQHINKLAFVADWQLCRIASLSDRDAEIKRFSRYLARAREAFAREDIGEALDFSKQALAIPGFERDGDGLALYQKITRYCRPKGINGVFKNRVLKALGDVSWSSLSPNGEYAIVHYAEKPAQLWSLVSGRCLGETEGAFFNNNGGIICRGLKPYRTEMTAELDFGRNYGGTEAYNAKGNILALHPDNRRVLYQSPTPWCQTAASVESVEILPDLTVQSRSVPTSELGLRQDGTPGLRLDAQYGAKLVLADASTGEPEKIFTIVEPGRLVTVIQCCFAPDGETFAVYYYVNDENYDDLFYVQQFETASGRLVKRHFKAVGKTGIMSFSPDGRFILENRVTSPGSAYNWLLLWHAGGGAELANRLHASKDAAHARFCPHGDFMAMIGNLCIEIRSLFTFDVVLPLKGHLSRILDFRLSADGKTLLSWDAEGVMISWLLEWDYAFPGWQDWDDGAQPYLENFLRLHPAWTAADFACLLEKLQVCGYGFIRATGIRQKLAAMAAQGEVPRFWELPDYVTEFNPHVLDSVSAFEAKQKQTREVRAEVLPAIEAVEITGQNSSDILQNPDGLVQISPDSRPDLFKIPAFMKKPGAALPKINPESTPTSLITQPVALSKASATTQPQAPLKPEPGAKTPLWKRLLGKK